MIKKLIAQIKQKLEVAGQIRAAYKQYKIEYPNGTYQGFIEWGDGNL